MTQSTAPLLSRLMPMVKVTNSPYGKKDGIEDGHADSIHNVEQKFEDCSKNDVSKGEDCHEVIL